MSRDYPRLDIVTFGQHLLESGDLDPVYIALHKMELPEDQLHRWLIAYWSYYSCAAASWISEQRGVSFFNWMSAAAENVDAAPFGGRWPRGHERRHARGSAAVKMVAAMRDRYGTKPEDFVHAILDGEMTVRAVMERASTNYLFGKWISFKISDMVDCVLKQPVDQSEVDVFLYDTPKKSILAQWARTNPNTRIKDQPALMRNAMLWLADQLEGCSPPHKPEETIDNFTLETIWCKHASHMSGHYPLWNDIDEICTGLEGWRSCETAQRFYDGMPKR